MKERRAVGATHSFRLSPKASKIVDEMNHPRRLGGKSAKVSTAIEAYYGKRLDQGHEQPSYQELLNNIQGAKESSKGCSDPTLMAQNLKIQYSVVSITLDHRQCLGLCPSIAEGLIR